MLKTPVAIRPEDRLKVKAKFLEPVYAAVVAIQPNGRVRWLEAPANPAGERPVADLSVPPGADDSILLADPGPTALVLLASRPSIGIPAAVAGAPVSALVPAPGPPTSDLIWIIAGTLRSGAWRTGLAGKTWIFDGEVIAPVQGAAATQGTTAASMSAALVRALQSAPGLNGARAALFEVGPPK